MDKNAARTIALAQIADYIRQCEQARVYDDAHRYDGWVHGANAMAFELNLITSEEWETNSARCNKHLRKLLTLELDIRRAGY